MFEIWTNRRGAAAVEAALGHVDILVNTPASTGPRRAWRSTGTTGRPSEYERAWGFFCAQASCQDDRARFGRIIFISSQSGLVGIPGQAVYCATKGALVNLVRALGVEWAKHGITVNSSHRLCRDQPHTQAPAEPTFRAFVLAKIPKANWRRQRTLRPRLFTWPAARPAWSTA